MSIKYAILGLLHYKDMHGYRIKSHIERNFGHMWSINFGQIYPNLRSLLDEGLVTMKAVDTPGEKGPGRKLYSITEEGKQAFAQWLAAPPEGNTILRDPFLMRFIFYGFGAPADALKAIDHQLVVYTGQLAQRQDNLSRWRSHDQYVRLMAELGVSFNTMVIQWLENARAEIEAMDRTAQSKAADGSQT